MNKIVFKNLLIVDLKEKKAFNIDFNDKINIITSDKDNGNKKGKSIIMKSLYHCLGADCFFDDKWQLFTKTFLLTLTINNTIYYFYRFNNMFKIFNSDKKVLFRTEERKKLSIYLKDLFGFSLQLPNRNTGDLELTPPAFWYLLNYLDQDKMSGSKFSSFKNLDQYKNFKEDTLYSHFGVFNEEYYNLTKSIQELDREKNNIQNEIIMLNNIISKIDKEIGETTYCESNDALNKEIENSKEEYEELVQNLSNAKSKLINLRNTRIELESNLADLRNKMKNRDAALKKFDGHICPICNSEVDSIFFKHNQFDKKDDFLYLSQSLEAEYIKIIEEIEKEESVYKGYVSKLNNYNQKIKTINQNIDSVIKHKGYIEMRDNIQNDLFNSNKKMSEISQSLKEENKKYKKYTELKKTVNSKYYNLMIEGKKNFNLKEIEDSKFENIKYNFEIGGSNKPICTIIWYFNLLNLKYQFNPDCARFPIVLDSPNNAELDDTKKKELFNYIFSNVDKSSQLIISTLGFNKDDYPLIEEKVINLENEKYELLTVQEYQKRIDYLKIFINENEKI